MKNFRRCALARIQSVSSLNRQYWMATGGWRRRIRDGIGWYFFVPLFAILLGAMCAGFGLVLFGDVLQPEQRDAYALIAVGMLTLISLMHAWSVLRELIGSRSLAIASVMPVSDRKYVSRCLGSSLKKSLLLLACVLFLSGGIAFGEESGLPETCQILLVASLLWVEVAAFSVIVPAFCPAIIRPNVIAWLTGFTMLLATVAFTSIGLGIADEAAIRFATMVILPTGWPILLIKYGLILEQPEFWWLLVPIGFSVLGAAAGYSRLLHRYHVFEFDYQSGSLAIAEFQSAADREPPVGSRLATSPNSQTDVTSNQSDRTKTAAWIQDCVQKIKSRLNLQVSSGASEELTREQAIARIRECHLTRRLDWSAAGIVERAAASMLSDDEQLSAEILSIGSPRWSWALVRSLVPATTAIIILVAVAGLLGRQAAVFSGHIGIAAIAGTLAGGRWAAMWKSSNGEACSVIAFLPIDSRCVARIAMALGAVRSVLIFPFAAGVILAISFGMGGALSFFECVLFGAKAVLILAAAHQWWFFSMQPYTCTQSIWKSIPESSVAIIVLLSAISGLILLLLSGRSEILAIAGSGLLFGTGWCAQRIHHFRVLKSPTDFVVHRPSQQITGWRTTSDGHKWRGPSSWPRPLKSSDLPS
ncbi:MAG: hypothetical protein O3B86_06930 [Planctomycetota bacterium]|nr:hypothetical protein [Planctomycetota bacterium]